MSNVLYDTKHYEIRLADGPVLDEAGEYSERPGYFVINKETNVVEHTTMFFPQAIYQAQGFSDSVDALTKTEEVPSYKELDTTGDGFVDTVEKDTTGDGKVDTVLKDTTGDGHMDQIKQDTSASHLLRFRIQQ